MTAVRWLAQERGEVVHAAGFGLNGCEQGVHHGAGSDYGQARRIGGADQLVVEVVSWPMAWLEGMVIEMDPTEALPSLAFVDVAETSTVFAGRIGRYAS